jgi:hypothetical protein
MKVLFDCAVPCALAHGGLQIQIDQTMASLRGLGVAVEPLRWWDEHQTGDILHYFGRVPSLFVQLAHQKGMKVVFSDFLGSLASRPPFRIQA